ncbi:UDP-glycosyltransferase 76B1, partial [Bienertia sinuspersici]
IQPMSHNMKEHRKMGVRLVLFPLPLQGHVTPIFHLATLLYSKGFSITIIQTNYKSLNPAQFPNFTFHFLEDGLPENVTFAPNDLTSVLNSLNKNCLEPFKDYLSKILSEGVACNEPIACLIADPMWSFAGAVASSFNLPRVVVRCASMYTYYVYHSLPILRQKGYYPLQESKCDEPVPELPPLKIKDLPPETGHELLVDIMTEMESSQGIICNTFKELEGTYITRVDQVVPIPIFPIGPIHKNIPNSQASIWAQDHTSISWLNTQAPKSVLYVSFGSIAMVSKADFLEIAYGLANSKQPFLWVVRNGIIEGSGTNDPLPLPDGYLEMVWQRGHIVNWAPQQEVLAHPAIGGFWTHCGWNSIMESISEGVPMLCLPFFADQAINTRHVSDNWKIGLQLKGITREEIQRAIRKMMVEEEGEEMRNRITALKEKANLSLLEANLTIHGKQGVQVGLMSKWCLAHISSMHSADNIDGTDLVSIACMPFRISDKISKTPMEKQESKLCCRVVLFPQPYTGHTTPMFNLGSALHTKGFSITVIHTHFNSPDPTEFPNFKFHFIEDVLSEAKTPASGSLDTITILNKSCMNAFRDCLSNILEDASKDNEPVACLISDPLWEFAGVVAEQLNLPRLALRTGGLLASILYESLPLLQEKGYFPLQEARKEESVLEVPPLKVKDLPPEVHHGVLLTMVKETKNSSISKEQFLEVAWGLAKSQQPFLWVTRPSLINGSDKDDLFPENFLENVAGRGHIVTWAPQQQVLAHPAVGGFWTHCGWNSTIESICEGVPMICLPFFGDQKMNARHISDVLKTGLQLEKGLERQEIERAIRRLMVEKEGQEMRERAASLKQEADCCLMKGKSSFDSLDRLTGHILSFCGAEKLN